MCLPVVLFSDARTHAQVREVVSSSSDSDSDSDSDSGSGRGSGSGSGTGGVMAKLERFVKSTKRVLQLKGAHSAAYQRHLRSTEKA